MAYLPTFIINNQPNVTMEYNISTSKNWWDFQPSFFSDSSPARPDGDSWKLKKNTETDPSRVFLDLLRKSKSKLSRQEPQTV